MTDKLIIRLLHKCSLQKQLRQVGTGDVAKNQKKYLPKRKTDA
jgi:hypothetical protein